MTGDLSIENNVKGTFYPFLSVQFSSKLYWHDMWYVLPKLITNSNNLNNNIN